MRHLVLDRADVVIGHGIEEIRTVHGERIQRTLLVDRGRQEIGDSPPRRRPRTDHVVIERDQLAVGVETRLDLLERQRPRIVHGHVVFAGVDDLDRLADGLGRLHRRHHHVGVETPAEAAAQPHLMHHDEFGIDPGRTRRDRAGARRKLVAGIDVQDVALELGGGVHRLERRMDVDAGGVLRLHHLCRRPEGRCGIAVLDEELTGIVELLQPLCFSRATTRSTAWRSDRRHR